MDYKELAEHIIETEELPAYDEALTIVSASNDDLLTVLDAAFMIRRHYFGRDVSLHVIHNAKSGSCSENCSFCSQSASSNSPIPLYPMQSVEQIVKEAKEAHKLNAVRYCVVTSGRSPSERDLDIICEAAQLIKKDIPIQICTSLGLLKEEQAKRLKDAGVDRYNHNLESSARFFSSFCDTHTYSDRVLTAGIAKSAGMELCSGGIIGLGETLYDRVEMAFALNELGADSIPVNFLDPRPETPLEDQKRLTPAECLLTLAMFRFVNPDKEIRIAGGREKCLGSMQVLSLYIANSLFTTGYLTTPGQGYQADMDMILQAGFTFSEVIA